ncbi:MAG: radical SAM protein [Elusimicrobia bacterium]|nr:radical SAM protein [Elusimicrobiota bacterium]
MLEHKSYVISWNLTRRCNLACEHCYIDAYQGKDDPGQIARVGEKVAATFSGELSTQECFTVIDQLAEASPQALLILTGGEPLLRRDVFDIAGYASQKGLWVVVGTNGVLITETLARKLKEVGVKGMSLSLDSTQPEKHDRFRGVQGAFRNTMEGTRILTREGLPFIIQTTLHPNNLQEIESIANLAHTLGAKVFNLYFLVSTGRGAYTTTLTPTQYESAMHQLLPLQKAFAGKMLVNAKCAPHYQRILYETEPTSPFLRTFNLGAGGCPAGTHYLGITPNGDMTPCPYLPVYGGNLREKSFKDIWENSEVFINIRQRKNPVPPTLSSTPVFSPSPLVGEGRVRGKEDGNDRKEWGEGGIGLGGRCGACEFNSACGGCRARAYGETGNYMAEDALCSYEPGKYDFKEISFPGAATYGLEEKMDLVWTQEAQEAISRVPSFVRGMVTRSVEKMAREKGISTIDTELLQEIRNRLPAHKLFARPA